MAVVRNQRGRVYEPGKPLSRPIREDIVDLYNRGYSVNKISKEVKVSKRSVTNIVQHFRRYGTVIPFSCGGHNPQKLTEDILECIEIWKLLKPSIYTREIQNRLLVEGVCDINSLPSLSTINNAIHGKLGMTRKKLTQIPSEYFNNLWKVDEYLEISSRLNPTTMHFFDEASVVITSGNRLYGSSYRGSQAIEVQRYASNATYTVNLLHSIYGVDYFNVIIGPSNGEELVSFFENALDCVRDNGLPVFMHGDTVVMDNCGFHHGRITEQVLRHMFDDRGVSLLFQPPYSPHLNTCEYCFHQLKESLRQDPLFSQTYTEISIINSLNSISHAHSINYFRHCGYYM